MCMPGAPRALHIISAAAEQPDGGAVVGGLATVFEGSKGVCDEAWLEFYKTCFA